MSSFAGVVSQEVPAVASQVLRRHMAAYGLGELDGEYEIKLKPGAQSFFHHDPKTYSISNEKQRTNLPEWKSWE